LTDDEATFFIDYIAHDASYSQFSILFSTQSTTLRLFGSLKLSGQACPHWERSLKEEEFDEAVASAIISLSATMKSLTKLLRENG
jgi:hypothetical protein